MDGLLTLDLHAATPSTILQHATKFVAINTTTITQELQGPSLVMAQKIILWLLNDRAHLRQCNKHLKKELDNAVAAVGKSDVKIIKSRRSPKRAQVSPIKPAAQADGNDRALEPPLPTPPTPLNTPAMDSTLQLANPHAANTLGQEPTTLPLCSDIQPEPSAGGGSITLCSLSLNALCSVDTFQTCAQDQLAASTIIMPPAMPITCHLSNVTNTSSRKNEAGGAANPACTSHPNVNTARLQLQAFVRGYLARKRFRALLETILLAGDIDNDNA
ncbi:hypothetical protein H257_00862 [Aphanomyces astaci]|uniref:Uncharacterized protein n=1 Tax=Aphanomyces astaci TaxID=112090 RepID=W4HCF8_APHAT|nr:hypothetical protein H257_00862 [Aphanomyces astaci]ETV89670.1 hypothetical protein H257_00862 [Aphanomyces astaci]|eukprot:XP_009822070.1 hypothetical protein H257_00862 [Aphanomyces astaci]